MSLIRSNSTLIAFSKDIYLLPSQFYFLNFIQNINFEISSNRINSKFIGSENLINNQFVKPELNLNVNFLQKIDFFNENLFGLTFVSDYNENKSIFNKLILDDFFVKNAFILFSELQSNDLIYQIDNNGYNSSMISTSLGNLYLNSYSFSYKIGDHPNVSASFIGSDLKISNLSNSNLSNWDGSSILLDDTLSNSLISQTNFPAAKNIAYTMKNLSFSNTFDNTSNPGPSISSFSQGLIQSMDFSINIEREKLYFLIDSNSVSSRKIKSPIKGTLRINGISNKFESGSLDDIFTKDEKFDMTISISAEQDSAVSVFTELQFQKITVEKFNYSLDLNSILNYSIECSFQITSTSGLKIKKLKNINPLYATIKFFDQSDGETFFTSDFFDIYALS